MADALAGSWRAAPPPTSLTAAELGTIAPLLLASGGAGLAWRRLRDSLLAGSPEAAPLRQAYRLFTVQAPLRQRDLQAVLAGLRTAGVEPVLVKGWAVARLYPEPGLRPYGDLDLCVREAESPRAEAALRELRGLATTVDLHAGGATLDSPPSRRRPRTPPSDVEWLFARSRLVDGGGVPIRVPAPEDHLRVLCTHLLRHGAARALWLCDVALVVESRPPDFDWERCLGPDPCVADWVACTVGLAGALLGARVDDTPMAARAARLPRWLIPAVLEAWGQEYRRLAPLADHVRRPRTALAELRHHWPNPIAATAALGGPFGPGPRFPFQVGATVRGLGRVLRQAASRAGLGRRPPSPEGGSPPGRP